VVVAMDPSVQNVLAGHWVAIPYTQNEPGGQRDAEPLVHTFLAGQGSHSHPPRGASGFMMLIRPWLQRHWLPNKLAFAGQEHWEMSDDCAKE